ncbi:MAG: hypothetical protein M3405_15485 [Acidobacteriota bacterium]|jgi:hypothetical protein|nr:hypothetical protein [Acidobacteriota bacterium]
MIVGKSSFPVLLLLSLFDLSEFLGFSYWRVLAGKISLFAAISEFSVSFIFEERSGRN